MKHEKMNFAGVEMDVIVGHPDYELLFVGKQVADAAGLHDGSNRLSRLRKEKPQGFHKVESPLGR